MNTLRVQFQRGFLLSASVRAKIKLCPSFALSAAPGSVFRNTHKQSINLKESLNNSCVDLFLNMSMFHVHLTDRRRLSIRHCVALWENMVIVGSIDS